MLFKKNQGKEGEDLPEPKDKAHWEALLRGQVLSATIQKFMNFVNLADQKAQAMIILNSILIPFTLNWIGKPMFEIAATIAIVAAVASILSAIMCIYPKRRKGQKPDGTYNLLHFGDIGRMREDKYLELFNPVFNDLDELSEAAVKDLHDMARRIIIPKFFWLKISYGSFFVGNVMAIAVALWAIWSGEHLPV